MVKSGEIIELEITKTAYGGKGIGKIDESFVVFVEGAVPGDKIKALIRKKKSSYAEALISEIVVPSKDRVPPPCPYFGQCGGCTWQNLSYEAQLASKEDISLSALSHIGGASGIKGFPIISSPDIWRYRNKMDFTFGTNENDDILLGMHKKGSFHQIVDIEKCLICPEDFEVVMNTVKDYCKANKLSSYNQKTHKGLLRHLVIREGKNTGEIMVMLLTASEDFPGIKALHEILKSKLPNLKIFMWGINASVSDAPKIDKISYQSGEECYNEKLGNLSLKVSPFSFMQTNTNGAERLYSVVKDYLELGEIETIFDAYCGSGSIGLFSARPQDYLLGIDIITSSIWDARRNAALNGMKNVTFLAGEMKTTLPLLLESVNRKITRLIVDPPRSGMDKKSINYIININSPIVVYVSCNPTTLARDMQLFTEAGYTATKAQPVDMFPHTYHIEMIVQFKK